MDIKTLHLVLSLLFALTTVLSVDAQEPKKVVDSKRKIRGVVTDFEGRPLVGAEVIVVSRYSTTGSSRGGHPVAGEKTYKKPDAMTVTDSQGVYELELPEGIYHRLGIFKDYGTKYLEFWAYGLPAEGSVELDARIDRLEVFNLQVWQGAQSAQQGLAFFRPMSLSRVQEALRLGESPAERAVVPLSDLEVEIWLGEVALEINSLKPVPESVVDPQASDEDVESLEAYFCQFSIPQRLSETDGYKQIRFFITDRSTGDRGEGVFFLLPR